MKKSLLALFAAAALSSGMAMAVVQGGDILPVEPTTPTAPEAGTSQATFQWSGLIPERDITNNGTDLFIVKADGSRDFLDGSLVFTNVEGADEQGEANGKDKIVLTDSTTLSFEVHDKATGGERVPYEWTLRYIKVGVNEQAPADYKGTFFDIASNDTIVEFEKGASVTADAPPTNLKVVSRFAPSSSDVTDEELEGIEGDNDIANTFKALDTVVVQAAIVVKAPTGSGERI